MSGKEMKETISKMTFKEKVDYLWTYYKWVLVVALIIIMGLNLVFTAIRNKQTETLYSGILVNVGLSNDGQAYITSGWFNELDGVENKQKVDLTATYFQGETFSSEQDYAPLIKITTMVAAKELDYFIMDDICLDYYQGDLLFESLEKFFTEEELEKYSDYLVYYSDENVGEYPIAIDITDTAFAVDCIQNTGKVYLAFPENATRTEKNHLFFEYLLNWE